MLGDLLHLPAQLRSNAVPEYLKKTPFAAGCLYRLWGVSALAASKIDQRNGKRGTNQTTCVV